MSTSKGKGKWLSTAGKVTIGLVLVLHRPCVIALLYVNLWSQWPNEVRLESFLHSHKEYYISTFPLNNCHLNPIIACDIIFRCALNEVERSQPEFCS